jgi:hypothetical protein
MGGESREEVLLKAIRRSIPLTLFLILRCRQTT